MEPALGKSIVICSDVKSTAVLALILTPRGASGIQHAYLPPSAATAVPPLVLHDAAEMTVDAAPNAVVDAVTVAVLETN